jgi:hypothetical protein
MFFRAEDVFGFSERVIAEMKTFEAMKEEFQRTLPEGSRGQLEAMGLASKERAILASRCLLTLALKFCASTGTASCPFVTMS